MYNTMDNSQEPGVTSIFVTIIPPAPGEPIHMAFKNQEPPPPEPPVISSFDQQAPQPPGPGAWGHTLAAEVLPPSIPRAGQVNARSMMAHSHSYDVDAVTFRMPMETQVLDPPGLGLSWQQRHEQRLVEGVERANQKIYVELEHETDLVLERQMKLFKLHDGLQQEYQKLNMTQEASLKRQRAAIQERMRRTPHEDELYRIFHPGVVEGCTQDPKYPARVEQSNQEEQEILPAQLCLGNDEGLSRRKRKVEEMEMTGEDLFTDLNKRLQHLRTTIEPMELLSFINHLLQQQQQQQPQELLIDTAPVISPWWEAHAPAHMMTTYGVEALIPSYTSAQSVADDPFQYLRGSSGPDPMVTEFAAMKVTEPSAMEATESSADASDSMCPFVFKGTGTDF